MQGADGNQNKKQMIDDLNKMSMSEEHIEEISKEIEEPHI